MKKTTKTTALAVLIVVFFGLAACQEEVIPINEASIMETSGIFDTQETETKEGDEDGGEDIRD